MSEDVYLAADQAEEEMVAELYKASDAQGKAYMSAMQAFLERPSVERRWTERLTAFLAEEGLSWDVEWRTEPPYDGDVVRSCRPCVVPVDRPATDVSLQKLWLRDQEMLPRLPGSGRYLVYFMQEIRDGRA